MVDNKQEPYYDSKISAYGKEKVQLSISGLKDFISIIFINIFCLLPIQNIEDVLV